MCIPAIYHPLHTSNSALQQWYSYDKIEMRRSTQIFSSSPITLEILNHQAAITRSGRRHNALLQCTRTCRTRYLHVATDGVSYIVSHCEYKQLIAKSYHREAVATRGYKRRLCTYGCLEPTDGEERKIKGQDTVMADQLQCCINDKTRHANNKPFARQNTHVQDTRYTEYEPINNLQPKNNPFVWTINIEYSSR